MGLRSEQWRKSSYSSQNGECVEIAPDLPAGIGIRDSKNATGPALRVSRESFAASVRTLKARQR